jgi:hypothetical protein
MHKIHRVKTNSVFIKTLETVCDEHKIDQKKIDD